MKDIICLLSADALVFAAKDEVYPKVQLRRHLWRFQCLCKLCCKICGILCPRRQLHIANFCPCSNRELLPLCLGSPTSVPLVTLQEWQHSATSRQTMAFAMMLSAALPAV